MYVIGISGPPRSGKDTLAKHLQTMLEDRFVIPTLVHSLSKPMRRMAFHVIGRIYSVPEYERLKDQPLDELEGGTIRELMIGLSEQFMKPRYGKAVWAKLLLNRLPAKFPGIIIVPDFGFPSESEHFMRVFGEDNVLAIQLTRAGFDWGNDSRSYVSATYNLGLENSGDFESMCKRIIDRAVNHLGWKL